MSNKRFKVQIIKYHYQLADTPEQAVKRLKKKGLISYREKPFKITKE